MALEIIKKVGFYIALASSLIAVANGVINKTLLAPLPLSVICVIGVVLWLIGLVGTGIVRLLEWRNARNRSGHEAKVARPGK